jgi:uncharacterized membrane protein YphA (DoxX/SURF4 family)
MEQNKNYIDHRRLVFARRLLRLGLAFVFAYASFELFVDTNILAAYLPNFIKNIIPEEYFFSVFAISEMMLAAWLLSGWKVKYAAIIAFFLLFAIVSFNLNSFTILFRNIAIGCSALALALLEDQNSVVIN